MYYNTTHETGDSLAAYHQKANTQDATILAVFHEQGKNYAASDLLPFMPNNTPITSIRRALNTLEAQGHICKTNSRKLSSYGRPENIYRLTVQVKVAV